MPSRVVPVPKCPRLCRMPGIAVIDLLQEAAYCSSEDVRRLGLLQV
jgi:hypothetical protein